MKPPLHSSGDASRLFMTATGLVPRLRAGGRRQGTPLIYDGVLYMPNPSDVIQAIVAA